MNTITPPNCSKCQGTLVEKKNEKGIYFACPNWKPKNEGCEGEFWSPPTGTSTGRNGVPRVNPQKSPENEPGSSSEGSTIALDRIATGLEILVGYYEAGKIAKNGGTEEGNDEVQIAKEEIPF